MCSRWAGCAPPAGTRQGSPSGRCTCSCHQYLSHTTQHITTPHSATQRAVWSGQSMHAPCWQLVLPRMTRHRDGHGSTKLKGRTLQQATGDLRCCSGCKTCLSLTHSALVCEGTCRVHLCCDHAVHGVDRDSTGGTQVDITQTQHQVGSLKHNAADLTESPQAGRMRSQPQLHLLLRCGLWHKR
jgi:hypothetical protein